MKEDFLKYLEFIQNIITRMNKNSFSLKALTITIISALLAVFATTKTPLILLVSIFPVLIFWLLDAYYLTLERKYRGLYNDAVNMQKKLFDLNINSYTKSNFSYYKVFFSKTIFFFYCIIVILLILLFFYH